MNPSLANNTAFRHHHDRHLQPLQRDLEDHRRSCWRDLFLVRLPVSLVLLAAVAIVPLLGKGPEDDFWWWAYGFIVLFTAAVLGMWCVLPWFTHRERLKSEVLPRLVPFFGDFRYEPEPKLEPRQYLDWAVLPTFDKSSSEDSVSGRHAGVAFSACELRLTRRHHNPGSRAGDGGSEHVVFKGLLMAMTTPRPVTGTIVLGTRNMFRSEFRIRDNAGLQEVFLEQTALQAWASDPDAAIVLLKPDLLARIEATIETLGIRNLRMGWHDDQLVILVDFGRNLFELSQRKAVDFYRDAEQVRDDLALITDLIDSFELDPGPDADAQPAPLAERMKVDNPAPEGSLKDQKGCIWMILFPVIGFCAYAYLLAGHMRPLAVLGTAAIVGVLAGVFLVKLLFHGGRLGTFLMLVACLLVLTIAVPEQFQGWLPSFLRSFN
jgi:hypothetical protein